jgi:hypothetical protein
MGHICNEKTLTLNFVDSLRDLIDSKAIKHHGEGRRLRREGDSESSRIEAALEEET